MPLSRLSALNVRFGAFGRQNKPLVSAPLFGLSFTVLVGAWFGGGNMLLTLPALAVGLTFFVLGSITAFDNKSMRYIRTTFYSILICFVILGLNLAHKNDATDSQSIIDMLVRQEEARVKEQKDRQLSANPAALLPDDKPQSDNRCGMNVELIIGSNHFGTSTFPFVAVMVDDQPYITVDYKDGGALVSFDLFDESGSILANVKNNIVFVPPLGLAYIQVRQNLHEIEIKDKKADTKISIYFANKQEMIINGDFFKNGKRFVATESGTLIGTNRYSDNTMCGFAGAGLSLH